MSPYLALLQAGFTEPPSVATGAVRSYRTISPLPAAHPKVCCLGGLLSVALSVGSRPPGVTWRLALWSPDFPPHLRAAIVWPTRARMVEVVRVGIKQLTRAQKFISHLPQFAS